MEWFRKRLPNEKREGEEPVVMLNPTTGEVIRAESPDQVAGAIADNNEEWKKAA